MEEAKELEKKTVAMDEKNSFFSLLE